MTQQKKYSQQSDIELIQMYCQLGDTEILGQLYDRYMHLVYGVCLKYMKDRERAKDGVMRIFEKLIHDLPHQKIDNFKPWLYAVTKNFCLMEIRGLQSSRARDKKWMEENLEVVDYQFPLHPLDDDLNDPMTLALKNCIDKLKDDQKQCIELFYFDNKCYQEIAEELNIDINKVKSYIQNGKRNLKICLENNHEIRQKL